MPPVPLREESSEAEDMARSLFIHFNGSDENIELLLRTVISANQLSVCGAVADLCKELSEDSRAPEKPEAPDHLETMEIPTGPSIAETHSNEQQRRNLVQDYERKFEQLSDDQKFCTMQHAFVFVPHECCTARACVSQVCDCLTFSLRPCGSGWVGGSLKESTSCSSFG